MTPQHRIVPLRHAADVAAFGGKASNLARLIGAGMPVPDGIAIAKGALESDAVEIDMLTSGLASPVIVRSSAIGEDSAEASFAGQLESVADVTSVDLLRDAIAHVWASRRSERVISYERSRRRPLDGMGIIVQHQIDAAVSGVLFTVSPNDAEQMLLEYCEGPGEALVSGAVNPGRVVISRTRETLEWKQVASLDVETGKDTLLLHDTEIARLAHLGLEIERLFGSPQDIEWTIDRSGKLWIVQSRPITTFRQIHNVRWSNANVSENFPQPISPLLYSIARAGYYHYFRNLGRAFGISERRLQQMEPALRQIIGVHGARMYYNLTSIHSVLRSAPFGELLAGSFNQFVGAEATSAPRAGAGYRVRQALELIVIAYKTTWQYLFLTRRVQEFEQTVDEYAAATHPDKLRNKSLGELLADFRAFIDIRCHRWKNASLADAASMVCYGALQRLLARAFPARDQQSLHNSLLKALPDLVSGIPPIRLWELSRMIRADRHLHALVQNEAAEHVLDALKTDPRYAAFRDAFEDFLEHWGFRCSAELMLTVPSFQEDPAPLIELLKSYVSMNAGSPADLLERQAAERVVATKDVLAALGWRRAFIVGTMLRWTQRSIQLRERARLKQALLYSRLRRVSLAVGQRLVESGRLSNPDDVFLLTAEELELLAAGGAMFPDHVQPLVALRRAAHAELGATTPPDSIDLAPGQYLRPVRSHVNVPLDEGSAASLTGIGACGGRTTATAAILLDVTEAHKLEPGDVLVTRQTDPGWGPVFPLISGLVIERGGMLSHGAIIAREFGIPSVVGVKDATRLIPHGSRVVVDGDRGVVQVGAA